MAVPAMQAHIWLLQLAAQSRPTARAVPGTAIPAKHLAFSDPRKAVHRSTAGGMAETPVVRSPRQRRADTVPRTCPASDRQPQRVRNYTLTRQPSRLTAE